MSVINCSPWNAQIDHGLLLRIRVVYFEVSSEMTGFAFGVFYGFFPPEYKGGVKIISKNEALRVSRRANYEDNTKLDLTK